MTEYWVESQSRLALLKGHYQCQGESSKRPDICQPFVMLIHIPLLKLDAPLSQVGIQINFCRTSFCLDNVSKLDI